MKKSHIMLLSLEMMLMTGCATQINLEPYVDVEFEGYDGSGTASFEIDYEDLATDYEDIFGFDRKALQKKSGQKFLEKLKDAIDGELSEEDDLANGDKITFSWILDTDTLEDKYKVKFAAEDIDVKVKHLDEEDSEEANSDQVASTEQPTEEPEWNPTEIPLPTPTDMPLPTPTEIPLPTPTEIPLPTPTEIPLPTPTQAPVEEGPYTLLRDAYGNVIDLGGMDIVIRDWWSSDWQPEPSNAYEEELYYFREWMQETYNFTLVQKAISDWGSTPADYLEYATTGPDENNYVFMQRPCTDLTNAMRQGLMKDLSKLDCLDFSEAKWVAGVHNAYSYKDGIYGMAAEGAEPRLCVYFNKRVLMDAGIEPDFLYDIQENMQWTWDKFEEICAKVTRDLDGDGVNDVWGYVGQDSEILNGFVYSNGGEYIGRENGEYVYKLEDQATLDGLRKALELNEKYLRKNEPDGYWDYYIGAFAQGNVAFFIDQAYRGQGQLQYAQEANGTSFDWGVLCMPMGPNATDYTNVYDNNIAVIPANYDDQRAWNIAFAYDMWYEPVPGYENYQGWKVAYQKHYKDTESVDLTLARLMTNGRVTYHGLVPNVDMGPQFFWRFGEFNNDPAALAEAVREIWKAYIDEANK